MNKKIKKIIATGVLSGLAATVNNASASLIDQSQQSSNSLNQQVNKVNKEVVTALASFNTNRSPWNNGNLFVNGFANGSWGRGIY